MVESRLALRKLSSAPPSSRRCSPRPRSPAMPDPSHLQIATSQSGNYLSALVAGADRDTAAAAVYSREALRADPRNVDLIERAFAAALADGDVADGFPLAERLIARDPTNSLARLALAARAIADGQYAAARTQLAAGDAGKAHDVTTTLLTAWSLRRRRRSAARARDARPHSATPASRCSATITPA